MNKTIFYCSNKCCKIKITPYIKSNIIYNNFSTYKAGIFIFDPQNQKILLVQSNGNLWGIPKGTIQKNESFAECAIREVYEETGLVFNTNNFIKDIYVYENARYFYVEKSETEIEIQKNPNNNDANGISWIKINCLKSCVQNGNIEINSHTRILLKKFLNINIKKSDFITITRKRSKTI